jgi:stage III sporulation protein AD
MEQVIRAAAVCVMGALLAVVVKRGTPELAVAVTLAAAAAVLLFLLEPLGELLRFLTDLAHRSGVPQELFLPLYKTIGIALVVRVGGDLCRDAGESALASVMETAGSVCALLAALPLLSGVLALLMELMG